MIERKGHIIKILPIQGETLQGIKDILIKSRAINLAGRASVSVFRSRRLQAFLDLTIFKGKARA